MIPKSVVFGYSGLGGYVCTYIQMDEVSYFTPPEVRRLTRRQLLKEMGVIAVGGALTSACTPNFIETSDLEEGKDTFDPESEENKKRFEIIDEVLANGFSYMSDKEEVAKLLQDRIRTMREVDPEGEINISSEKVEDLSYQIHLYNKDDGGGWTDFQGIKYVEDTSGVKVFFYIDTTHMSISGNQDINNAKQNEVDVHEISHALLFVSVIEELLIESRYVELDGDEKKSLVNEINRIVLWRLNNLGNGLPEFVPSVLGAAAALRCLKEKGYRNRIVEMEEGEYALSSERIVDGEWYGYQWGSTLHTVIGSDLLINKNMAGQKWEVVAAMLATTNIQEGNVGEWYRSLDSQISEGIVARELPGR